MSTANASCHISYPKHGQVIRVSVCPKTNEGLFLVYGHSSGIDAVVGHVLIEGEWIKGKTVLQPNPFAPAPQLWAILFHSKVFATAGSGLHRLHVCEPCDGPTRSVVVGDRSLFRLDGPTRDPLEITNPLCFGSGCPPLKVCPTFFATCNATGQNVTSVTFTLGVMSGFPAQAGLPVSVNATSMGGSIWTATFNVSEGSNRQLDAVDNLGNHASPVKDISNTNTAC